jgi:hypothetical protein
VIIGLGDHPHAILSAAFVDARLHLVHIEGAGVVAGQRDLEGAVADQLRAAALGRKLSVSMACCTLLRAFSETRGCLLRTRDTVLIETPDAWATSLIVARKIGSSVAA